MTCHKTFNAVNPSAPKRVGLLGGSFNPPHAGHLHLATWAQETLQLDEVWLLPVPLNTLKEKKSVAPFEERVALCQLLSAPYAWLCTRTDEKVIGTNETIDTVQYFTKNYPHHTFVWLMGADSFASVHAWGKSATFTNHIATAIFSRTEVENTAALNAVTAQKMPQATPQEPRNLGEKDQTGWCFVPMPIHPARATDIRKTLVLGEKPPHISQEIWQEIQKQHFYGPS